MTDWRNIMTKKEYEKFIWEECARQWKDNQEEGTWEEQPQVIKEDYFNDMWCMYIDNLDVNER